MSSFEPRAPEPVDEGPAPGQLRLLRAVQAAQRRSLWTQGASLGLATLVLLVLAAGLTGLAFPGLAQLLLAAALPAAAAVLFGYGLVLARARVGDEPSTARLIAERLPGSGWPVLGAVELRDALESTAPAQASRPLIEAYIRQVEEETAGLPVEAVVPGLPARRAALVALAAALVTLLVAGLFPGRLRAGLVHAVTLALQPAPEVPRQPITGDFELAYTYPAHTGLSPVTVSGTTGEVSGPKGTVVQLKTYADRPVSSAVLVLNGAQVPLTVSGGRELAGTFVLDRPGSYHVSFLSGSRVVASGPELPVQVEADQSPQVRLLAPVDEVELEPERQQLSLSYEATDDHGLSALALVFQVPGREQQKLPLRPDEGRVTRGAYTWQLGALNLPPGAQVKYFLEATDNDAIDGPKVGTSRVQVVSLFSAEAHRRAALEKAQALWERLVAHLADRMESAERTAPSPEALSLGRAIDERAEGLASSLLEVADGLEDERFPPRDVASALRNVGTKLRADTLAVAAQRRLHARYHGRDEAVGRAEGANTTLAREAAKRVQTLVALDVTHSEANVLYLEALLDRLKLDAIRDLAREMREDRRELSRLLEQFRDSPDDATRQALLEKMGELKERMLELSRRMAEMAQGIRDDFLNEEALDELQSEEDLKPSLEDIEKLVREGKAEEALKQMQQLAMELDQALERLEEGAARADEEADPELARAFAELNEDLEATIAEQEKLAEQTQEVKDRYREEERQRLQAQGERVKSSVKKKLQELQQSLRAIPPESLGFNSDELKQQAASDAEHVQEALEAQDFDLAAEAAERLEEKTEELSRRAQELQRRDELFQNPPAQRQQSQRLAERLDRDAEKAGQVRRELDALFPPMGERLSEADQKALKELSASQAKLQQQARSLQQQMEELGDKAPLFDEEAQAQVEQAGQKMGQAAERLKGRDPGRAGGQQQGALQALRGLQQQLQSQPSSGRGRGLPLPMPRMARRSGRGTSAEKVEIPESDPNQGPREFRKDVLDAMKQGAPDRYRDLNKRYYEELVK